MLKYLQSLLIGLVITGVIDFVGLILLTLIYNFNKLFWPPHYNSLGFAGMPYLMGYFFFFFIVSPVLWIITSILFYKKVFSKAKQVKVPDTPNT